jgi:chitinase
MAVNFHTPWQDPLGGTLDIVNALDYFTSSGMPANKINLGLGAYGRSWTLASPSQTAVGSPAYSAGQPGQCTREWESEKHGGAC